MKKFLILSAFVLFSGTAMAQLQLNPIGDTDPISGDFEFPLTASEDELTIIEQAKGCAVQTDFWGNSRVANCLYRDRGCLIGLVLRYERADIFSDWVKKNSEVIYNSCD